MTRPLHRLWKACAPLFPAHASLTELGSGHLQVTWWMPGGQGFEEGRFAAPIAIHLSAQLLERLDAEGTQTLAECETAIREGLRGYDPFARRGVHSIRLLSL